MISKKLNKASEINSKTIKSASVKDLQTIMLLKPKLDNSKSVLKALQQRKTIREISEKKLSLQTLSNLLWAAYGVNRNT